MTQIESTLNAILQIPEIQQELAIVAGSADAAQAAADAANAAAATANDAAAANKAATALQGSYVSPDNILSAKDNGTSTEIDIAAHTRVYSDGTSVVVDLGAITGLAYSTTYYIYYDDPSRTGGSVSYQSTTDSTVAAQTGDRHTVGSVETPAAAAPPATGVAVRPPGVGTLQKAL